MSATKLTHWYAAGLHFECMLCGNCCAGPEEGFIWVTRQEIELIADFLKMPAGRLRQQYLRRVGFRTTVIEQPVTNDCIFLREEAGQKRCMIYPVRPSQCRAWPFWLCNLAGPGDWNKAGQKCPGINRGRLYSFEQIQKIKRDKKAWQRPAKTIVLSKE